MLNKNFLWFLGLFAFIGSPAFGQTTATQTVPGYYIATGQSAGGVTCKVGPCFVPFCQTGQCTFTGNVFMPDLPTEDPHVAGQLWNNAGVVTVSTGA